ncbi:TRAP transporter small permease [Nitratireductor sp. ZSWI3]|uniref:TRAP transporter small permease n=1 Tax=Nitratireductor sp. ZSWI3 TaxID=2966359 RepID=UPI00215029DC|nr:TRAP transporter small permease [Nitratireductor sp. ZSWI3]MCR4268849.1 TRAP transporter small permease [Nitratireductor sp. ZSWI3]
MNTFERYFLAANKWALVLLLSAMAVIVFANVSLRYLTNFSIIWAEEVARYLMIWMTFLGAGMALRAGGHVAIGNFQELLGTNAQRMVRVFILLLLVAFCAIMIWMGKDYMTRARFQMTPATRVSFSYIYAAMPIGFTLLIVHLGLIARSFVLENRFAEVEADAASLAVDRDAGLAANRD